MLAVVWIQCDWLVVELLAGSQSARLSFGRDWLGARSRYHFEPAQRNLCLLLVQTSWKADPLLASLWRSLHFSKLAL